jgi:tRNA(Ile2)-agmatinylcytidine synthase
VLTEFHIGIDDTDSKMGGCTTYTAALLYEEFCRSGFEPIDFPWLVRLNPNIPWKTRGNGALAIHLRIDERERDRLEKTTLEVVEKTTDPSIPATDPALVFLNGQVPPVLRDFSTRALYDVLTVKEARRVARVIEAKVHLFRRPRGLIGALAAIGSGLEGEHTFEIIAYRKKENMGTPRLVDKDSATLMDSEYRKSTFNNIDPETGRLLICPHGPDPVLFGIRGEDPVNLVSAFGRIRTSEPIERVMLFKTNHGTDAHLTRLSTISSLRPHQAAVILGTVETDCRVVRGGHVVFTVRDNTGIVDCVAYEPSGSFRNIVRQLIPGDTLKACGGVRRGIRGGLTLNLEKLEVLSLAEDIRYENPRCPDCRLRCESMGRAKGFRCRRCSTRYPSASRITIVKKRRLSAGVFLPPPRAHRHLTKPASRYDPSNSGTSPRLGFLEQIRPHPDELERTGLELS